MRLRYACGAPDAKDFYAGGGEGGGEGDMSANGKQGAWGLERCERGVGEDADAEQQGPAELEITPQATDQENAETMNDVA